jgi:SAM-dependent methyltransferase
MTRLFIGSAPAHERPAGWTIVGMDRDAHLRLDVAHEALPLPTGSVDLVVLAHELHRVPAGSVAFLLGEVRRVLKPGGWRTSADGSNPF